MRKLLVFTSSGSEASVNFETQFSMVNLGDLPFKKYDIQNDPEKAVNFHLAGVPTVIMMDEGREEKRNTGYMSKEEIEEFIK